MTSKEALERIYNDAISLNEIEEDVEKIEEDYNIIKQDLERLKKLNNIFSDSHICEIKVKFNEIECNADKCKTCSLGVGDEICLKNTFEHKWKLEEENKKLKQAIEILKEFNIELTFENDTYFMDCCKSNDIELNGMDWGDRVLTKEEYLLLKEVFENG